MGLSKIVNVAYPPSSSALWAKSTKAWAGVLGGVLIALIGIVGEYIGRIYLSINRCPQYVVRNVIDRREPTGGKDDAQ